ncbi:MAG: hypothetical protein AB7E95_04845 [Kiritimatiellales bacterium]
MSSFRYSIWLAPCAEQREILQRTIDLLSSRFGTPSFEPHATLCSGVWNNTEADLADVVDKVGRDLRARRELSLSVSSDGIDWIERWFGFFFLRLRCESDCFERAGRMVKGSHSPEIGPHVSLLYSFGDKMIDRKTLRAELAETLPDVIRFDSLALVRPSTGGWEDIADWETLYRTGKS